MTTDIHSCSFYCDRPECIRRQRDDLRDQQTANVPASVALSQLHALVRALRGWLYFWPDYGGPPAHPSPAPMRELHDELERAEGFLAQRHTAHFATCPHADQHRRSR